MPTLFRRVLVALIAVAGLSACAASGGGAPRLMVEGEVVAPPIGWSAFCARSPEHCAPAEEPAALPQGAEAIAHLVTVNLEVNRAMAPSLDAARFGVADRWALPSAEAGLLGDCEDYALEKRRRLIDAGWPPGALRLAVATSRQTGVHAALIALTAEGEFVLDNLVDEVRPWTHTDYIWLKRQASADPTAWRAVRYQ